MIIKQPLDDDCTNLICLYAYYFVYTYIPYGIANVVFNKLISQNATPNPIPKELHVIGETRSFRLLYKIIVK